MTLAISFFILSAGTNAALGIMNKNETNKAAAAISAALAILLYINI